MVQQQEDNRQILNNQQNGEANNNLNNPNDEQGIPIYGQLQQFEKPEQQPQQADLQFPEFRFKEEHNNLVMPVDGEMQQQDILQQSQMQ